ncbi:RICIN domain-containing protein [Phytomonospora sp. NPDC050363]|uniref:RICIN domain-containing protein n=1 Tax=Phytomonospora sp. NPDC050363 TaxID=3155642 RepID=UPI0033CC7864
MRTFQPLHGRARVVFTATATALLALAAGAVIATATPAAADTTGVTPVVGGTYRIVGTQSGKCFDVKDHSTVNGGVLQQWSCGSAATWQRFRVSAATGGGVNLVNVNSGRCLDVPSGAATLGLVVQQWGCGTADKPNQRFTITSPAAGVQQIKTANGLCLTLTGASAADGTPISQNTCGSGAEQRWAFQSTTAPPSNTPDGFASLPGMGRGPTTGGAAGQTVTVTTQAALNQYVTAAEPYVVRVAATIDINPKGTELRVASNKTIIGVGTSGVIVGGGFFLGTGVHNVIIRNLTIRDTRMPDDDPGDDAYDYDAIQLDTADHIWIDHNRLTRMNDGLIDSRKDTSYLTVSWNHLVDNNKTFGIGWTDNVTSLITIHHNWFQNTNSRNPSADNIAACHLYNNYLQDVTGYGHFARGLTKAVVENSYFDSVRDPYYVEAGELVQRGNIVVDSTWSDGRVREKGSAFDPSAHYAYTLDPAAAVPALLTASAGPQPNIGV